jgi:hypothetical protein
MTDPADTAALVAKIAQAYREHLEEVATASEDDAAEDLEDDPDCE